MSAVLSSDLNDAHEINAAHEAARLAWESDDEAQAANLPDSGTAAFANAFLQELIERQESSPGIFRRLVRGANRGAKTLNVDRLQGLTEVMQNADDVGATTVRFSLRTLADGRQQLLVAHNGARIRSGNVVPMALPFISTKSDDAEANGRFGIGLKTLRRIADAITVHGAPYHFTVSQHQLAVASPEQGIPNMYEAEDTLLVLDLKESVEPELFAQWFAGWEAESLLFLRHVDSLSWVSPSGMTQRVVGVHRGPWQNHPFSSDLTGFQALKYRRVAGEDAAWTIWRASIQVPEGVAREGKATGETVDVSLAFPDVSRVNQLYARFSLRITSTLACAIDAPFDPDTSRENLIEDEGWNSWLITKSGALLQAVALGLLQSAPARAWSAIPTLGEGVDSNRSGWLANQFAEVLASVRKTVVERGEVRTGGRDVALSQISYEHSSFADVLDDELLLTLLPSHVPLSREIRDAGGRWRQVVKTLGVGKQVGVPDVLNGFASSKFTNRESDWWVAAGAAAVTAAADPENNMLASLIELPFLLAETGLPVAAHGPGSALWLVPSGETSAFEARWELFPRLHPAYRRPTATPVISWLRNHAAYGESPTPAAELRAFAEKFYEKPVEVTDEELRHIRDRFDLLEDAVAQNIGPLVGSGVLLRGLHYVKDKPEPKLVRPCDAYLSKTLDKEHPYWPQAAGTTDGIDWIAARYDEELKTTARSAQRRSSGARASRGPRRFLVLLGAAAAPRKRALPEQWGGAGRRAADLAAADATHVEYDVSFPDLEKVLAHMTRVNGRRAAERSVALLRMLSRHWEQVFEPVLQVQAWKKKIRYSYPSDPVAAQWLNELRSAEWLVVGASRRVRPEAAVLRSEQTATFREADLITGISARDVDPVVCEALGVVTAIRASHLLAQLRELQQSVGNAAQVLHQARDCYRALAAMCPKKTGALGLNEMIGDLKVLQLRQAFRLNQGLVAVLDQASQVVWRRPENLLIGPNILHDSSRFAPGGDACTPLWTVLNVRTTRAQDCVEACRAIVERHQTPQQATGALIDIYRALPGLLINPDKNLKDRLKRLPLACGDRWYSKRPVYLVEDETLRWEMARAAPDLVLWDPPCDITGLDTFLKVAGIQRLELDLSVVDDRTLGLNGARGIRERFECAVDCLADELARHAPSTRSSMRLDWDDLRGARLHVYQAPVRVRVTCLVLPTLLPQGAVHVRLEAFWDDARRELHVWEDALALRNGTARALAQLFPPPVRHSVEAEWMVAWQASVSAVPERIRLWDDEQAARRREEEATRMTNVASTKSKVEVTPPRSRSKAMTQRTLKDDVGHMGAARPFAGNRPADEGGTAGGSPLGKDTKERGSRSKSRLRESEPPKKGAEPEGNGSGSVAAYSRLDLEQRGWELLSHALEQEESNSLKDFRSRRGVGADGVIEWREFVELKATGGGAQGQVELTTAEYARAKERGADFILALAYGLEDGFASEVRLIRDPLRCCRVEPVGSVRLSALLDAPAIIVPFSPLDESGSDEQGGNR